MLAPRLLLLSVFLIYIICNTNAQSGNIFIDLEKQEKGSGKVKIIQDAQVNELISRHIDCNSKLDGIPGYRIRIFSKSGNTAREEMNITKARFLKMYPEIRAYEDYDQVNFKVYVGDFLTMSEALKILHSIKEIFPGVFIISTTINYPKSD